MKTATPPDLNTVLDDFRKEIFKDINCINIGTIQEFDTDTQLATIRLSIKQVQSENEDGTRTLVEHPVLAECPVVVMNGGGAHLTFPIAAGDSCLVLFNDRDIDNWLYDGGISTPNTYRVHDISDGFAIVGIKSLQESITSYLTDGIGLRLNVNDKLDIRPANVLLQTLTSSMNLILNAINTVATLFTHTGNVLITGYVQITGAIISTGGTLNTDAKIVSTDTITGSELHAGNGATGSYANVTVVDGIVTGGS